LQTILFADHLDVQLLAHYLNMQLDVQWNKRALLWVSFLGR